MNNFSSYEIWNEQLHCHHYFHFYLLPVNQLFCHTKIDINGTTDIFQVCFVFTHAKIGAFFASTVLSPFFHIAKTELYSYYFALTKCLLLS